MGRGSNLVVSDRGFEGLVLRLGGDLARIVVDGGVAAGGGASLPQLARAAAKAGRLGLEFMVGIPGTVGGAVRQNAGCFGREVVDVLEKAEVFDLRSGQVLIVDPGDLAMAYRSTSLLPTQVVTRASFITEPGAPEVGEEKMREITRWRRHHQPGGTLNAGSVFKNPPGDAAGRIIDSLGLKGLTVGGAAVSSKHANFFEAQPGTSALDVYRLVMEVARIVEERTGIQLETEIQFVGDFGEPPHG
jgi:UDP-N-acetylmuramate dehydrogenase